MKCTVSHLATSGGSIKYIYIHYISIDNKTLVATGSVKENSSLDWRALVATNTCYLTIKTVVKYRTELQQATFANIDLTFLLIILKQSWAENRPHFTFTLRFLSTVKNYSSTSSFFFFIPPSVRLFLLLNLHPLSPASLHWHTLSGVWSNRRFGCGVGTLGNH